MASVKKPLPKNKPLRVGITGGIGAGKTVVAKIFSILGVPVFNADLIAKQILRSNPEVISKVKKTFGEKAYTENRLNREYLAQVVFSENSKREVLNSIVHPEVGRSFDDFCEKHHSAPYVLKEAAIMIETGSHQHLDLLLLVSAPEEIRLKRVVNRDRTNREAVEGRMSAQLSDDEKRLHANFEIVNDDKNPVIPKVLQIHNTILRSS